MSLAVSQFKGCILQRSLRDSEVLTAAHDAVAVSKSEKKKASFGGAVKVGQPLLHCYDTPCHRLHMFVCWEQFNQFRQLHFNCFGVLKWYTSLVFHKNKMRKKVLYAANMFFSS